MPDCSTSASPQIVGVKWMLVDLWWCVFLRHVDASASFLVDLCCYSKIVGLVVTTLFSESDVVWCVVCCAESQCWFALKGTWSVYIYTFDPKTVNLYIYIYLWSQDCGSGHLRFQNSLLWPVLLLVLINTAMPLIPRLWIGIITFDPKTVDLYKDFRSQDCGSFKLELSSEYGVVSCFLYWLSKLTWYEIMHGRGLMNSLYKSPHSFHLIRKKELPPEYPVTS